MWNSMRFPEVGLPVPDWYFDFAHREIPARGVQKRKREAPTRPGSGVKSTF